MASSSYYLAESLNQDPALLDEYGDFFGDDFLDTVGGMREIEQTKQAQEQGFIPKNLYASVRSSPATPQGVVRKGQEIINTINLFESDARKEQTALLEQAQDTNARANELYANLSKSLEELSARMQRQFEEQSEKARIETEASKTSLEELKAARRRALSGEGLLRETAPARALGIGEIMTSGRAARGGSQRAATSQFLRNPSYRGLK